jgi:hypothetical protein
MYESFFGVENLTAVKKRSALDASPSPFVKKCCEEIYRAIWADSKGYP